jgi:hypothetical protein
MLPCHLFFLLSEGGGSHLIEEENARQKSASFLQKYDRLQTNTVTTFLGHHTP